MFLGRAVRAPQVRCAQPTSASKFANILHITHRDQVEAPITDWLREAYDLFDKSVARETKSPTRKTKKPARKAKSRGRKGKTKR